MLHHVYASSMLANFAFGTLTADSWRICTLSISSQKHFADAAQAIAKKFGQIGHSG